MSTLSSAAGGSLKLQYGDDIHHLSSKQLSWQDFVSTAHQLFKLPPLEKDLVFKYRDSDGDLVSIVNEEELRLAQAQHSQPTPLRLYVAQLGRDKEIAEIWDHLKKSKPDTDDEIRKLTWKMKVEHQRYKKYKRYAKEGKQEYKRDKKLAKKHKKKGKELKHKLKKLKGETEEEKKEEERRLAKKEKKRLKKAEKLKRKDEKYQKKKLAKDRKEEEEEESDEEDESEEEEGESSDAKKD